MLICIGWLGEIAHAKCCWRLEHNPSGLNLRGYQREMNFDSTCGLVKEASLHVPLTFLADEQIDGFEGPSALVAVAEMRTLGVVVNQP